MASTRVSEAASAPEPPFEGVGTATGGHYTGPRLTASPLKRLGLRRSATAAGIYVSVAFGFLGTLFAARQLGPDDFGLLAVVVVATGFFQSLLDLTAEEALVKYGFDYAAGESWGRLRRLFRQALLVKGIGGLAAGIVLVAHRPGRGLDLRRHRPHRSRSWWPHAAAAPEPRGRRERGAHPPRALRRPRLAARVVDGPADDGLAVGAHFGVTEAVMGIVVAQAVATALLAAVALAAFRRFPAAEPVRLEEDRRGILRFVFHSSLATGVVSLRGALAPLLLGIVSKPVQVGFFRIAQAPQQGLASLSAPARLIMLTEQTRDWARGATAVGVRGRAAIRLLGRAADGGARAAGLHPHALARAVLYGEDYEGASDAARLVLLAGALHFVFGWSKSLPVSIGRPGCASSPMASSRW